MIKRIVSIFFVSLILISCLIVTANADFLDISHDASIVPLRAGGGSSGGGGGGSNGPSHRHYYGTGRPATLLGSIIQFIMFPLVLFSSTIIFYFKLTKRSRKAKKLMNQMMQSDNAWKYNDISATVEKGYFAIQTAWSNMDMTPASQFMSDELYDSFQTQLNWMAYKNEKVIMENIRLLQALPVAVYDDNDNTRDYIWFYIKGKMVDYIIDANTQLKISGNTSDASFVEYWQFIRKDDNWVLNKILQKNESDQIPFTE